MNEFEKLKSIISEILNVDEDEITMESSFQEDLNADSLDVGQILMSVEDEFGIMIPDEDLGNIKTVGEAVERIRSITGE